MREGLLARLAPGPKVAGFVLLCLVVGCAPYPAWQAVAGALGFLVVLVLAGGVDGRRVWGRLLRVEPLVLVAAGGAALGPGGPAFGLELVGRATVCAAAACVLAASTPPGAVVGVLRRWGVPAAVADTLMLTARYTPLLGSELRRMGRAQRARGLRPGVAAAWVGQARLLGRLWVRAGERAARVHRAMRARGWGA